VGLPPIQPCPFLQALEKAVELLDLETPGKGHLVAFLLTEWETGVSVTWSQCSCGTSRLGT
jgi:hypothetical protein